MGREYFSKIFRLTLGPTHPLIQWVPYFFPGSKAAVAWSWPLTTIYHRSQERVELYLCSLYTLSWRGQGQLYQYTVCDMKTKGIRRTLNFRGFCIVAKIAWWLRHFRASVCPHISARLPLHGFSWNLILGGFIKICREIQTWLKSGKNIWHFTRKPKDVFIFAGDMNLP
jgi:hypothetical protein